MFLTKQFSDKFIIGGLHSSADPHLIDFIIIGPVQFGLVNWTEK